MAEGWASDEGGVTAGDRGDRRNMGKITVRTKSQGGVSAANLTGTRWAKPGTDAVEESFRQGGTEVRIGFVANGDRAILNDSVRSGLVSPIAERG